jgi:hypothetical protein
MSTRVLGQLEFVEEKVGFVVQIDL